MAAFNDSAAYPATADIDSSAVADFSSAASLPATADIFTFVDQTYSAASSIDVSSNLVSDAVRSVLGVGSFSSSSSLAASAAIGNGNVVVSTTIPLPTISSLGVSGYSGGVSLSLAPLSAEITGLTGVVGVVSTSIPKLAVSALGGGSSSLQLPALTVSSAGLTGVAGNAATTLPALAVSAFTDVPNDSQVSLSLPLLAISGAGVTGVVGDVSAVIPSLRINSNLVVGNVGNVNNLLPTWTLQSVGAVGAVGLVDLLIPIPSLVVRGLLPVTFHAWSIEPTTLKHSKYLNYPVVGFVCVGGIWYAALSDGLYSVGGTTDNNADINVDVLSGANDMNDSGEKSFPYVYFGGRANGSLEVILKADGESREYYYRVSRTSKESGLHNGRAKMGRGLRSRYVQIGLRNVSSASFDLDSLEVMYGSSRKRKV